MKTAQFRVRALTNAVIAVPLLFCVSPLLQANSTPAADGVSGHHAELLSRSTALEAEIDRLTAELHPHDPRLAESHLDHGHTLQALGRHEEAVTSFETALQIHRRHHGLFHPDQLPMVDQLLDSQMALQRWEDVDALQHFRFHVAKQQLPLGVDTRLAALTDLTLWKLEAAERGLLDDSLGDAYALAEQHRAELRKLAPEASAEDRARLHLSIADLELLQARQKMQTRIQPGFDNALAAAGLGMHGPLVGVAGDDDAEQLIEDVQHWAEPGAYQLDLFDISRHLHEYKSSIREAYALTQQASAAQGKQPHSLSESIQRSLDDYNGFLVSKVLRRF